MSLFACSADLFYSVCPQFLFAMERLCDRVWWFDFNCSSDGFLFSVTFQTCSWSQGLYWLCETTVWRILNGHRLVSLCSVLTHSWTVALQPRFSAGHTTVEVRMLLFSLTEEKVSAGMTAIFKQTDPVQITPHPLMRDIWQIFLALEGSMSLLCGWHWVVASSYTDGLVWKQGEVSAWRNVQQVIYITAGLFLG